MSGITTNIFGNQTGVAYCPVTNKIYLAVENGATDIYVSADEGVSWTTLNYPDRTLVWGQKAKLQVGTDGTLHVIGNRTNNTNNDLEYLSYRKYTTGGVWTSEVLVFTYSTSTKGISGINDFNFLLDSSNNPYLVFDWNARGYFTWGDGTSSWDTIWPTNSTFAKWNGSSFTLYHINTPNTTNDYPNYYYMNPQLVLNSNGTAYIFYYHQYSYLNVVTVNEYSHRYKYFNGTSLGAEVNVSTAGIDTQSSFEVISDGTTLYLFYMTSAVTTPPTLVYKIYYKTFNGTSWSTATEVASFTGDATNKIIWLNVLYENNYLSLFYQTKILDKSSLVSGTGTAPEITSLKHRKLNTSTGLWGIEREIDFFILNRVYVNNSWTNTYGDNVQNITNYVYSSRNNNKKHIFAYGKSYQVDSGNSGNKYVHIDFLPLSYKPIPNITNLYSVGYTLNKRPKMYFTFSDSDEDSTIQNAQIQVNSTSSFNGVMYIDAQYGSDVGYGTTTAGWTGLPSVTIATPVNVTYIPQADINAGTVYLRVRCKDNKNMWSDWVTTNFKIQAPPWSDTITPTLYGIRAIWLNDIATVINNAKLFRGLTQTTFTDGTVVANSTDIKALHITQRRTAIADIVTTLHGIPITWTDATLDNTYDRQGTHIQELRNFCLQT